MNTRKTFDQLRSYDWIIRRFGSGTQVVMSDNKDLPHFYVWGHKDDEDDRERYRVTDALLATILGNINDEILVDFVRINDSTVRATDKIKIEAVGPQYDNNPPHLEWRTRIGHRWDVARKELIDFLMICSVRSMWARIEKGNNG